MKKMFTFKKRLMSLVLTLMTVMSVIPAATVNAAENYNGGWAMADQTISVYSDVSCTTKIGTIYQHEGFTMLNNLGYNKAYVEYSTSSGAKRGYVSGGYGYMNPSCVAVVTTSSTLYYGNNTGTYQVAGTVYSGELVAVLAKNDNWVYVEYNTNSGRKRGYMPFTNLSCYNRPGIFRDLYNFKNSGWSEYVSGTYNVRSGPSTQYPAVGTISNENVTILGSESTGGYTWSYIEYTVNGSSQKKSGFVLIDY